MALNVAVQMDPLETIKIAGDSSFALMLSAQARGHRLFHYLAEALTYVDGRVTSVGYREPAAELLKPHQGRKFVAGA